MKTVCLVSTNGNLIHCFGCNSEIVVNSLKLIAGLSFLLRNKKPFQFRIDEENSITVCPLAVNEERNKSLFLVSLWRNMYWAIDLFMFGRLVVEMLYRPLNALLEQFENQSIQALNSVTFANAINENTDCDDLIQGEYEDYFFEFDKVVVSALFSSEITNPYLAMMTPILPKPQSHHNPDNIMIFVSRASSNITGVESMEVLLGEGVDEKDGLSKLLSAYRSGLPPSHSVPAATGISSPGTVVREYDYSGLTGEGLLSALSQHCSENSRVIQLRKEWYQHAMTIGLSPATIITRWLVSEVPLYSRHESTAQSLWICKVTSNNNNSGNSSNSVDQIVQREDEESTGDGEIRSLMLDVQTVSPSTLTIPEIQAWQTMLYRVNRFVNFTFLYGPQLSNSATPSTGFDLTWCTKELVQSLLSVPSNEVTHSNDNNDEFSLLLDKNGVLINTSIIDAFASTLSPRVPEAPKKGPAINRPGRLLGNSKTNDKGK